MHQTNNKLLLNIKGLRVSFYSREGNLQALNGVSFKIFKGKTIGIVGESGCGKSVTAQSILRIVPKNGNIEGGEILLYKDEQTIDLTKLDEKGNEIRNIRGSVISMVFQEPMTSFSPVRTIGKQIIEVIKIHQNCDKEEAREKAITFLHRVGMPRPEQNIDAYPFNLSGGMRQRAMIAMALSCIPELVIADEPTSALDVTIQSQILRLLRDLQQEYGMAVMMITHDLGVIAEIAERVVIMYLGESVEYGPVRDVIKNPRHPYTQGLLASVPKLGRRSEESLIPIKGSVPSLYTRPTGCPFEPRCPKSITGICNVKDPETVELEAGYTVKCHLYYKE